MSTAGILRFTSNLTDRIMKSAQEAVTHHAWVSQSGTGKATYTDISRVCLVEQKVHQRRMSDGRMVTVYATLTFLKVLSNTVAVSGHTRVNPVDPKDRFTLADGSSGPILDVSGLRKSNHFYLQVFLGADR